MASTGISGDEAVQQLWTACSLTLQRSLHNGGATSITDPKALLDIIKTLAVKQKNNMVNIVELWFSQLNTPQPTHLGLGP